MNDAKHSDADIASLLESIDRRSDAGRVIRALLADRDRLAAELKLERTARRIECEMSEACCQCQGLRTELSVERARIAALRMEMSGRSFAQQEAEALRAELSAARADAERYRWLRSRNELTGEIDPRGPYVIEDDDGNTRWPTGNQIDAAIDAARAASSAGGQRADD